MKESKTSKIVEGLKSGLIILASALLLISILVAYGSTCTFQDF